MKLSPKSTKSKNTKKAQPPNKKNVIDYKQSHHMKKIIWHGCLQKQGTELNDPRVPSNLLFLIRYMSIMGALLASSLFLQEDPFICVTSH